MKTRKYDDILQEAEKLPRAECLRLIERLVHSIRMAEGDGKAAPSWEDYAGSAPYPLCGEDAQEWVSRDRRQAGEERGTR